MKKQTSLLSDFDHVEGMHVGMMESRYQICMLFVVETVWIDE